MTEPPSGVGAGAVATAALLAARCLDAACAVEEPGAVDRLREAVELLDRTLDDAPLPGGPALARARDRAADLLVGLSAAGVDCGERDTMVAQLREALTDLAAALRAEQQRGPWQPTAPEPH